MKNIFDEEDETDYELIDPDLTANSGITAVAALSDGEKAKLLNMEQRIRKRIIGQDAAISEVCKAIRRNQVGFKDAERPVGSFIFLGTTGTGKTELCRALAEILYGDKSTDAEYKKHGIYDLKLKPQFPHKAHKLSLKVIIIGVEKQDNGHYFYRAIYRNLSTPKLCILKKVLKEIGCLRA